MQHKLILIDGISGSGKSTTAQYLARQLNLNGYKTVWHHEEEENHPLHYAEHDIETIHSLDDVTLFMQQYPLLVEAFVADIKASATIHIIESYYLQDSVRILFQNNIPLEKIKQFFSHINALISPLAPLIVCFRHVDVAKSIRHIWAVRGDEWKKWFIDTDSLAPYVQQRGLAGDLGVLTLWQDYQDLTDGLLTAVTFPIIQIEAHTPWPELYRSLLREMKLQQMKAYEPLVTHDMVGKYVEETDEPAPHACRIYVKDDELYWDGFWLEQQLLPLNEAEYVVHGFPIHFVFQKQNGIIDSFIVQGTLIYDMLDARYIKQD